MDQTDKVILSSVPFVAVAIHSHRRRYSFSSPSLLDCTYYPAFEELLIYKCFYDEYA